MVNLPVLKINREELYFSGLYLSPFSPSPRTQTGWSERGEFEDGIGGGDEMWGPDSGMFSLEGQRKTESYTCVEGGETQAQSRGHKAPTPPPPASYQPLGFSMWGPLIWVKPLIPAPHLQAECLTSVQHSIVNWSCLWSGVRASV